jgi:glycosyltransferase involved in cell wall biosynthesis
MNKSINSSKEKWKEDSKNLTIAFIGRFTQQKRPYLFLYMAKKIKKSIGRKYKLNLLMMGEGELKEQSAELANKFGLGKNVSFVSGTDNVEKVLRDTKVVIIASENEGLTLVAMEAVRANCVVVSCDVGAQKEIVADRLLISRYPFRAAKEAAQIVSDLVTGRLPVQAILEEQNHKLRALDDAVPARDLIMQFYS